MNDDYLRGLREALVIAHSRPTAFAFSVAAEIQSVIDAEEKRIAPVMKERKRLKSALAPRSTWYDGNTS
jgi:hypothetical protein